MKVIPFGAETAYSRIVRSMPWLLMPWLPVLPRNWKLWYWIWMINRFVSSTKKEFNIFCHLSEENCWKCKYIFMFHSKKQPQQSLSNPGLEKCHDQFQNKTLACYLGIISHKIIALVTQAWRHITHSCTSFIALSDQHFVSHSLRRCIWHIYNHFFITFTTPVPQQQDNENMELTHWGRVTPIWVSKQTIMGPDIGLSPGQCQAIIWTNADILLIGPLGTIRVLLMLYDYKPLYVITLFWIAGKIKKN